VNYKDWQYNDDGKSNHCNEFETKIEDLDVFKKILEALNFRSLTVVDKLRKSWSYNDYEISIDEVATLGSFVEVEYTGSNSVDPQKVAEEMTHFLTEIGCGTIERNYVGYPFLLLFPKDN